MFSKDVLYIILNSLVFSKLFYCSTIWSGNTKENIHKLQLMENVAGRILTNTKSLITLHQSYMMQHVRDATMILKCLNGLVSGYLSISL